MSTNFSKKKKQTNIEALGTSLAICCLLLLGVTESCNISHIPWIIRLHRCRLSPLLIFVYIACELAFDSHPPSPASSLPPTPHLSFTLFNILFLTAPCHSDQAGMNIQWVRRHLFLLRGRALARGSLKSASPLPSMHPPHHLRTPPYPPLPQHLGLVTGGYPTDPSGWSGWPVCPIGVG